MGLSRLIFSVLLVLGSALGAHADSVCALDRLDIRGPWGQARFTTEVADDAAERGQGLMFREQLARTAGMLFVYDQPQQATFWMQNTLIPLDMIFADENGIVTHIHQNAVPLDQTTIDGGDAVKFVFEINGGLVDLFGISLGSELRHPQIDGKNVAWSCFSEN